MSKTVTFILVVIGIIFGYAWSYQVNTLKPAKIYEDGSYYGCLKNYPCKN